MKGRVDLGLDLVGNATSYGIAVSACDSAANPTTPIEAGDYLYSVRLADGTVIKITSLEQYRGVLARLAAGDTVTATLCHLYGFYSYRTYEVELTAFEIVK